MVRFLIYFNILSEVIKMSAAKEEAKNLLDRLPDNASWGDIMYEFYVKEKIMTELKAAENGKVISHDEVKKRFLPK